MKFKRRFRRKFKYNKKRSFMFIFFFLLCLSFGLGYSLIQTDINIFGTTVLKDNRWDVHFDNIQEGEDSVSPTSDPEITDNTTVTFSAKLKNPGDKYEFLIDVVNAGTIDAKIGSITLSPELTAEQQNYFSYEVKYESDLELVENQALDAGTTETLKVTFKYLEQGDNSLYPGDDQTFNVTLTVDYVQGSGTPVNHQYLYDVLRKEAESGGLAKKYTGAHHDSFTQEPSKDIYHWYANNDTDGTAVLNKNNVIFANHCWQMIRTTDTGGVKMIYNGEAEHGQCLNTRGNQVGYSSRTMLNLNSNYWYGTDYRVYDVTNKLFVLNDNLEQVTWNATTGPNLVGKYTCKSSGMYGTCSTLFYIESYYNATTAYVIPINFDSNYSQFGTLQYNSQYNSVGYLGYMYDAVYSTKNKSLMSDFSVLSKSAPSTSYWYADSYTYDSETHKYYLDSPYQISSLSDAIGKYTFRNTSETYSASLIFYYSGYNASGYYGLYLDGGHDLNYYNYTYLYGDSYIDNGDGTYSINNPNTFQRKNWYGIYNSIVNKYICKDYVGNVCNDLLFVISVADTMYYYVRVSDNLVYSNGFTYDGDKYILDNDNMVSFFNISDYNNRVSINNAHYTCWNKTGECTTLSYIYYIGGSVPYYISLTGGKDVNDAVDEMLYSENVNTRNSVIKNGIDAWYRHNIALYYDDYLEDTIFCNNRSISSKGGWNLNGGDIGKAMYFSGRSSNTSLGCDNDSDKFSLSNNLAKLSYPVGLMSNAEMNLLNNKNIKKTSQWYWVMTPSYVSSNNTFANGVDASGNVGEVSITSSRGVRPAISLKPKTKYFEGDGSMEHPYMITINSA